MANIVSIREKKTFISKQIDGLKQKTEAVKAEMKAITEKISEMD